jgi:hypothetical protein
MARPRSDAAGRSPGARGARPSSGLLPTTPARPWPGPPAAAPRVAVQPGASHSSGGGGGGLGVERDRRLEHGGRRRGGACGAARRAHAPQLRRRAPGPPPINSPDPGVPSEPRPAFHAPGTAAWDALPLRLANRRERPAPRGTGRPSSGTMASKRIMKGGRPLPGGGPGPRPRAGGPLQGRRDALIWRPRAPPARPQSLRTSSAIHQPTAGGGSARGAGVQARATSSPPLSPRPRPPAPPRPRAGAGRSPGDQSGA